MDTYFQSLATSLSTHEAPDVAFYYLTGSPFWILPRFTEFMNEFKFPEGPVYMNRFNGDIKTLYNFVRVKQFKSKMATQTILDFMDRKFLLFGDSGQLDHEAYADAYKDIQKHIKGSDKVNPVQCIFIRLLSGIDSTLEKLKNATLRLKLVFKLNGIPQERWRLFYHPDQLNGIDLKAGNCYADWEKPSEAGLAGWDLTKDKSGMVTGATRTQ